MSQSSATRNFRLPVNETEQQTRLATWLQLVRTNGLIQRRIAAWLAEQDVTLPQFDVLATLRFAEGLTQQELAERMLVTKGNVCGLLDRLERLGWVERRLDDKDARVNRLHLTPAGRKRIASLVPEHDALVLEAMRALDDARVRALRESLETLERTNER